MDERNRELRRWGCFLVLGQKHGDQTLKPWTVLRQCRPTHWIASHDAPAASLAGGRSWIGVVVPRSAGDTMPDQLAASLREQSPGLPIAMPGPADTVTRPQVVSFARAALIYEAMGSGHMADSARHEAAEKRLSILETDVFAQAVAGASRQQILESLGISNNTLKKTLRSLLIKCDAINLERLTSDFLRRLARARPEREQPAELGD
jgi:DNA-binding CsgD family transcriptional regulator